MTPLARPLPVAARVLGLLARGCALLFGVLALLAVVAEVRGRTAGLSLWWIDLRPVAAPMRLAFLVGVGAVFLSWALARSPGRRLRAATAGACLLVAAVAIRDCFIVAGAVGSGLVRPSVAVPLSAVTAVLFLGLAVAAVREGRTRGRLAGKDGVGLLVATALWAVVFPLAQMVWFGGSDYRRPADAAVVFGARVYASGRPSPLLADRLRTGIDLYRSGLVSYLVMSGGDGADGFNEAAVMADEAVAAGVPREAVLVDPGGATTELTVRNSLGLLASTGVAGSSLIAVSQAYHLPRIQLAYSVAGVDVLTVPAGEAQPIAELPLFIAREVPAFWAYLVRVSLA